MSESERDASLRVAARRPFTDGATVGMGSLPHADPAAAAAFAIAEFDIATIPSLPKRSVLELMVSQGLAGVPGVSVAADGTPLIDTALTRSTAPSSTPLDGDAFVGLRSFLDLAGKVQLDGAPVKWQFVGPVTLGAALTRAGVDPAIAFDVASRAVRAHLDALSTAITQALPNSAQMVLLDEPWFADLMTPGFPIPPDHAIDLMSGAMAALPATTLTGIHCCAPCDVATLLASGPSVVSVPVSPDLVDWVGYLTRFLDDGGIVAWGAIATGGPLPSLAERPWRMLSDLWCSLVQRGCDPVMLRRQSVVTPQCGLSGYSVSVARRIARLNAEVGKRVKDQSAATKFALGA